MSENSTKISWKRAQLAVNRFTKTAETDVARLQQFKKNILEHEKSNDRDTVKLELSRAQQTVKQLKDNLEAVQAIRKEIADDDVAQFDSKMDQTRQWIMKEINSFADLDADFVEYLGEEFHQLLKTGLDPPKKRSHSSGQVQCQKVTTIEQAELEEELVEVKDQEERVKKIAKDTVDAKEIMTSLNDMVHEQGDVISGIEENVTSAYNNVKQGGLNLSKAVVLKAAGYSAVGAVCGALVGGPIGLVAGAKLGVVAAGAGVAVGATVGKKIEKMQVDANEIELQNLNAASDMAETRVLRQESVKHDDDS